MKRKHVDLGIGLILLIATLAFNLYLYRLEPTATIDPNDNTFQFALVDRTEKMWDYAHKTCSDNPLTYPVCFLSYLVDHWVPNWAEGYSLPFFYSHIPQIVIVGTYKVLAPVVQFISQNPEPMTLYQYYRWVIHLLLCLFPISAFLALRIIGTSSILAGLGAVFASQLSTDGLYGLDPPSFLWRGYGLSSQLFAMIWLPLAIASGYRFFRARKPLTVPIHHAIVSEIRRFVTSVFFPKRTQTLPYAVPTIVFTALTITGHLGLGIMAMLSLGALLLADPILAFLLKRPVKEIFDMVLERSIGLFVVASSAIALLSYWILPTLLYDNYHNVSFWDPIWKFDSYGWIEAVNMLFNGDLFDFGRFPVMTLFLFLGIYAGLTSRSMGFFARSNPQKTKDEDLTPADFPLFPFAFLFVFWLLMFFGRTTWGGLIDLVPGMKEVHLSRFIVGLHAAGIFLVPIGFVWLATRTSSLLARLAVTIWKIETRALTLSPSVIVACFILPIMAIITWPNMFAQTIRYAQHNDVLLIQANTNYAKARVDSDKLFSEIRERPSGRVFTGRGGSWGKGFEIAETPYYMHLSTYGVPTVLWMPQTWSPNSDIEQYFSEGVTDHFDLYNIRYIVAPPDHTPDEFWKYLAESPSWKLYEVETNGYFTGGTRTMTVSTSKTDFKNIVHSWTQSDFSKNRQFPELTFEKHPQREVPVIPMIDEVTYMTEDARYRNILAEPPFVETDSPQPVIVGPEYIDTDMVYATTVDVPENCTECIVVLKATGHPNWRVTVDGESRSHFTVFPFFTAVRVDEPGTYDVVFAYKPSSMKVLLMTMSLIAVTAVLAVRFITLATPTKKKQKK